MILLSGVCKLAEHSDIRQLKAEQSVRIDELAIPNARRNRRKERRVPRAERTAS